MNLLERAEKMALYKSDHCPCDSVIIRFRSCVRVEVAVLGCVS